MKKLFLFFIALVYSNSFAQNNTINVQAQDDAQLTWYGNYDSNVVFPVGGSYEKIIMDFTMGCADGGCSHWDYTVSIFLSLIHI